MAAAAGPAAPIDEPLRCQTCRDSGEPIACFECIKLQLSKLNIVLDDSLKKSMVITPVPAIAPPTASLSQGRETLIYGCNRCGKQVALAFAETKHTCDPGHIEILEAVFGPYEGKLYNNNNNSSDTLQEIGTMIEDDDDSMVVYARVPPVPLRKPKEETKKKKKRTGSILKKKGSKRKEPEESPELVEAEPPKKKVRFTLSREAQNNNSSSSSSNSNDSKETKTEQKQKQPDQVDINLAMLEILTYIPWAAPEHDLPAWLESDEIKAELETLPDNMIYSMALVEMTTSAFGKPARTKDNCKKRENVYRSQIAVLKSDMPKLLARCIKENIRLVREKTDQKALPVIAELASEFTRFGTKSYAHLLQLSEFVTHAMLNAGVTFAYALNGVIATKINGHTPLNRKLRALEDRFFQVKQANKDDDDSSSS